MNVTFIVSPDLFAQKFHMAAPLLETVVKEAARGEFTVDDIARLTLEGRVITAVVERDGVAILAGAFEFVHYPQTLAVNILALGGGFVDEVAEQFWGTFKGWCKDAGATVIEASCSNAMARLLRRYEFETVYQVVRTKI